jgi:hypothetical protein
MMAASIRQPQDIIIKTTGCALRVSTPAAQAAAGEEIPTEIPYLVR